MKVYLFIETGEVRKAHDEWRLEDGDCIHSIHTDCEHPILTRHEIEIPEGATLFQYQTNKGDLYHFYREEGICSYGHFPIPRPKRVKRWWWDFGDDNAADGFFTMGPYTEEEVKADYPNAKWYHRIDETMIEVEE